MGSVVNLMRCYFKQLREMSVHQFFKIWQLHNFNLSLSNIQRGQVLFMHDFQQNLLLLTQDETLATHWDHPQLTIHPTALFYLCLKCDKIVKEDLIHITMDKVHDKHAVNQFTQTSIEHVRKKGIPIEEIIEFTDHSASQYKSWYTFYYMTKLGIPCTRHYFGVKHSKGPSDRAGGNFKRTIQAAVKGGHELLHANAIEEYCKVNFDWQELCPGDVTNGTEQCDENQQCGELDVRPTRNPHSLFKVFNHSAISQPKENPHIHEIKGCRDNMHVVRNTGIEGIVQYQRVDCACLACTTHEGECDQKNFADKWITVNLLKHNQDIEKVQISEWFKPIQGGDVSDVSGEFMEFGDEDECEINCDKVESDKDEESNDESDEIGSDEEQDHVMKNVDSDEIENDIEEQVLGGNDERDETDDEALIYMFTEEYISLDEEINNDCDQQKLYADEIPEQIDEEDLNINFNWQKLGDEMKAYCNNYTSMRKFIERKNLPDAKVVMKLVMSDEDIIDTIALKFWPKDGPKNHVPIEMFGEGNCGPRALAHALLGNQSRYWEVRV